MRENFDCKSVDDNGDGCNVKSVANLRYCSGICLGRLMKNSKNVSACLRTEICTRELLITKYEC